MRTLPATMTPNSFDFDDSQQSLPTIICIVCLDESNMWRSGLRYLLFSKTVFTGCRWFKSSHCQNILFIIIHRISKAWQTNRLTMVRAQLPITAHTSSCVSKMIHRYVNLSKWMCYYFFVCLETSKLQNKAYFNLRNAHGYFAAQQCGVVWLVFSLALEARGKTIVKSLSCTVQQFE